MFLIEVGGRKIFGVDAFRGDTRSHLEHDGEDLDGQGYYTGDGMGESVDAKFKKIDSEI